MTQLGTTIRKHRHLAIALLVLAFCFKMAIPAGMMVSSTAENTLTVTVCTGSAGGVATIDIALPGKAGKDAGHSDGAAQGDHCAFTGFAKGALSGADPILLAGAFAFILVLGLAPARHPPLARMRYLLPPLRGPPAAA